MTHQTVRDAIANFCAGEFDPADVAELVRFAESHLGDDDDEPVTLDWMESVVPEDGRLTIAMRDGVGRVYLGESDLCDGIKIETRRQLRDLLKGLGR